MSEREYDVVVIGAGAAGIAAATRLAKAGLSHLAIEARDRAGGRAWTLEVASGLPVDLGCGWLHSAQTNPWVALAEGQGLGIDRSPPPWARPGAQIGPNREKAGAFGEAMGRYWKRVAAFEGPDAPLSTLLPPDDPFNPLIDAVSTYYSGAELRKVSIHDLQTYEDSGVNWRVREGYGAAIAGLAREAAVRYGLPVLGVDRSGPTLAVETAQGAVRCRAVIVTLPSALLAARELFRPALPEKRAAAEGLPLGLANKLYMALDPAFDLPDESRAFGHFDRPATGAYHFRALGRPVIEGYFGGDLAEALERDGLASAFAYAADELAGLFGARVREAIRPLAFHGWRGDPFAGGSYSYARVGRAADRRALAEPVEDRIFFAGEACSPDSFSTAHGAYRTGVAAADAAAAALKR